MLPTLKLFLPILIPSWRFFDVIAPALRIEYAILPTPRDTPQWQEFRPRPAHLSGPQTLARLFYNPRWNESLFLMSCAERVAETACPHATQEILKRIEADLKHKAPAYLQFRLIFITRDAPSEPVFISPLHTIGGAS